VLWHGLLGAGVIAAVQDPLAVKPYALRPVLYEAMESRRGDESTWARMNHLLPAAV